VKTRGVALGCLVAAGGDTSPGLQLVDQTFDDVPLLAEIDVVTGRSALLPFPFLSTAWSFFSGMTALIRRLRR